jgi:hypothetical protein
MTELINDLFVMDALQTILTTGAGAAIGWLILRLSPSAVMSIKKLVVAITQYEAKIITYVNDPTDALNVELGKKTPIPADVWAEVLPRFVEAFVDAMNKATGDNA